MVKMTSFSEVILELTIDPKLIRNNLSLTTKKNRLRIGPSRFTKEIFAFIRIMSPANGREHTEIEHERID